VVWLFLFVAIYIWGAGTPAAHVGFIVVGLVLFVELSFQPPVWLHLILWLPLTVVLAGGILRPLKGLMIAVQYRHKAEEGRLDTSGDQTDQL
jgi:uncharacterized protein (DUF983 family)